MGLDSTDLKPFFITDGGRLQVGEFLNGPCNKQQNPRNGYCGTF